MPQRGLRRLALEDYDDGGRDGWEEQEEEEDYYFEQEPYAGTQQEVGQEEEQHGIAAAAAGPSAGAGVGVTGRDAVAIPADEEEGGDTCAICLSTIELEDLAIVKGCEHIYCAHCILQWAMYKEAPWCPQCKAPFNYLFTHRTLDGTMSDVPVEDSVCLLKRAMWFVSHVKALDKGKPLSGADEEVPPEWAEGFYDDAVYDEEDEDEAIEQYYFSGAAGHARVVLGNRRGGENGFMRAGRRYARPANTAPPAATAAASGAGASSKGRAKGAGPGPGGSSSSSSSAHPTGAASRSGHGGGGGSSSSSGGPAVDGGKMAVGGGGDGPSGSGAGSTPGQGRRAKRNARRAAADV